MSITTHAVKKIISKKVQQTKHISFKINSISLSFTRDKYSFNKP